MSVTQVSLLSNGRPCIQGDIQLSQHYLTFHSDTLDLSIPYSSIYTIDTKSSGPGLCQLNVCCKHLEFFSFLFGSSARVSDLYGHLKDSMNIPSLEQLIALSIPTQVSYEWPTFSFESEFERMQVSNEWRITDMNAEYESCPTYPSKLIVPAIVSDAVLKYAVKFRSKGRIPALSYYHKKSKMTITRSSQPLVGLKKAKSLQDKKLVESIFQTGSKTLSHHFIMDARPAANAMAQTALGAGTESTDDYPNCNIMFLGIDNIHAVRDSMTKMMDVLKSHNSPSLSQLEKTGWMRLIRIILKGAVNIVQCLDKKSCHVLIHCSDGWDRTAQLSSLAQICLDPFYRTLNGLQILIEKEWCAFGHKFSDRCGHLAEAKGESSETTSIMAQIEAGSKNFWNNAAKTLMTLSGASDSQSSIDSSSHKALKPKEASPVFTQFLDCLYQIWRQFPTQFEYNEQILGYLNKHVYSCEFGDFLMNCERERRKYRGEGLHKSTLSIWEDVRSKSYIFANPVYSVNEQETVLIPNPDQIICWPLILQGQDISIQPSADNSDLVMSQLSELDIQSKEFKSQPFIPSTHNNLSESTTIETNADPLGVLLSKP